MDQNKNENIVFYSFTRDTIAQMGKDTEGVQTAISPRDDRPRVYLSYHPADFSYLKETAKLILRIIDCIILYYDYKEYGEPDPEKLKDKLYDMQLFAIPVTANFLGGECTAFDVELPFAKETQALILPLLTDIGLQEQFNETCGNLQFLCEAGDRDLTAIRFNEKLERFLTDHVTDAETAKRIREAFGKRIFLSYRKQDRRKAQELMRLIHDNPKCQDIAIWYDEYLTAGQPFEEEIEKTLQEADLVTFLVTETLFKPNAEGKDNYVKSTEYPKAVAIKQGEQEALLAVESEENQWEQFQKHFPAIRDYIVKRDRGTVPEVLLRMLGKADAPESDLPAEQRFLIGLAYLSGIGVERNAGLAVNWITEAANAGYGEAKKKLADMYYAGNGVERDLDEAINWQKQYVEFLEEGGDVKKIIPAKICLIALYKEADLVGDTERELDDLMNSVEQPTYSILPLSDRVYLDLFAGDIYALFDKEKAIKYHLNALGKARGLHDYHSPEIAKLFIAAGHYYLSQNSYALQSNSKLAKRLLETGISYLDRISDGGYETKLACSIYTTLIMIDIDNGGEFSKERADLYDEIIEWADFKAKRSNSADNTLAILLSNIGVHLYGIATQMNTYAGELFEKAERAYLLSKKLFERTSHMYSEKYVVNRLATLYSNLGLLYFVCDRMKEAKKYAKATIDLLKPLKESRGELFAKKHGILATGYMIHGHVLMREAKAETNKTAARKAEKRARCYYKDALENFQKAFDSGSIEFITVHIECCYALGAAYRDQDKKKDKAIPYYQDLRDMLEALPERNTFQKGLLAESYYFTAIASEHGDPTEVLRDLDKAIELYRELAQEDFEVCGSNLADTYYNATILCNNQDWTAQTIAYAEKANRTFTELSIRCPEKYHAERRSRHREIKNILLFLTNS